MKEEINKYMEALKNNQSKINTPNKYHNKKLSKQSGAS
jgi:hypothetical protein